MSSKHQINVADYDMFMEAVKAAAKTVESAKFTVGPGGLEMYGARQSARARCEIATNAVLSDEPVSFAVENVTMFLRVLQSIKDVHVGDYSRLSLSVDRGAFRAESNKFKTRYSLCDENVISQWVSKKVDDSKLTPVFEFITASDMIKCVNQHSFMFSDAKAVRVYIEQRPDMENNAVFATLGNKETSLGNEVTLKFGLVTAGSLEVKGDDGLVKGERGIILDLERLNLFNAVPSNQIKCQLMDVNCLVSRTKTQGKDGVFFDYSVYSTILKA